MASSDQGLGAPFVDMGCAKPLFEKNTLANCSFSLNRSLNSAFSTVPLPSSSNRLKITSACLAADDLDAVEDGGGSDSGAVVFWGATGNTFFRDAAMARAFLMASCLSIWGEAATSCCEAAANDTSSLGSVPCAVLFELIC